MVIFGRHSIVVALIGVLFVGAGHLSLAKPQAGTLRPDTSGQIMVNESGGASVVATIRGHDGEPVARLYMSGKKAYFDGSGWIQFGSGFVQAEEGKHFHINFNYHDFKTDPSGELQTISILAKRVEWNDVGKTLSVKGLDSDLALYRHSRKHKKNDEPDEFHLKITSNLDSPLVKDGKLMLQVSGKRSLPLLIKFGKGVKPLPPYAGRDCVSANSE